VEFLHVDRCWRLGLAVAAEDFGCPFQKLRAPGRDLIGMDVELLGQFGRASGTYSPLIAASATFALKAGLWFRRGRLLMVSPVHGIMPISGRNSTYPECPVFPSQLSTMACNPILRERPLKAKSAQTQGTSSMTADSIAVVIPAYRVKSHILDVISHIGSEASRIYVVDDCCPEGTGGFVEQTCEDRRVTVLFNLVNKGVGGATLAGMRRAFGDGATVIVKNDGDGQMDPAMIPVFAGVILSGEADYSKGNRFFDLEALASMPLNRKLGNAGLSFMAKMSTGYWHTFDPTNGYIAIHASLVDILPIEKISQRYFFESDMLFRLSIISARVIISQCIHTMLMK